MRILLASASSTARTILRGLLERSGCAREDLVEASAEKAVTAAFKDPAGPPALAVVDWDLPELDGPRFVRTLRETVGSTVGVLFCIRGADLAALSDISGTGPIDWIERPFGDAPFLEKVRALREEVEKVRADASARRLQAVATGKEAQTAFPFLLQLPSHLIDDLLKKSSRSRHAPGTILLGPNDVPEALHLVTQGEVEILEGTSGVPSRVSGEGDPFGELAFMTARPAGETVRARTEVLVASVSKAELSDVLRRHPRMSEYLSWLLARHRKAITARATTLSHADFKGTLDGTPFPDLVQLLCSTRKTGVLGFRDDERSGAIYLEDGEAIHAWTETLKGEEAFYEIAGWTTARFAFRAIQRQEPRTLKVATMTLLVEAMRRQDEQTRGEETPSPGAPGRGPF